MKKMYSLMAMALLGMASLMLTSCDNDDEIAYTLEGTWQGNMYVSSEWDGRVYDATYSELCFLRDPYRYSSGSGYWIDYYNSAGWGRNYVANHIEWTVSYGTIKIYFVEEGTSVWIEDYRLSHDRFSGVIYDGDSRVEFSLMHTSSPNWNDYYYGWDYGWDYYSKTADMTRGNDLSADDGKAQSPRRFFRTK